jgi:hypothetical protein
MDPVQPQRADAGGDPLVAKPELLELRACNKAPLMLGESRE